MENRQKSGQDSDIPASGIAIWHVDELGHRDSSNYKYNNTHNNYEVTLMQADNLWHFENYVNAGDAQDLFYLGNTAAAYTNEFNDTTALSAKWWDGTTSHLAIAAISASGDTMTFDSSGADALNIKGKLNGTVVKGVTVFLDPTETASDALTAADDASTLTRTAKTAADGSYSFSGLSKGKYKLTPKYSGVTFTPPELDVTLDAADEDDENFESSGSDSGSIVVTSPSGGEQWEIGTYRVITWNSAEVTGSIVIDVLKNGVVYKTIDADAENTESYDWGIDSSYVSGSDYQIRISSLDSPAVSFTSNMFSLGYPVMNATIGSTISIANGFNSRPTLYIVDAKGKKKTANIVSWRHEDTTFTWSAPVSEGRYTLFAKLKGADAQIVTDNFVITRPVINNYSNPVKNGKYLTMKLFGVTGKNPKVWWTYGDGKKLSCTVAEYEESDFTEPEPQEILTVKFRADIFEKFAPTQITVKNSMGQTNYQIGSATE